MTRSLRNRVRLFVSPLEDRVTPTAGALDRSFATGGVATLSQLKSVVDVAPTADGGAIVLGPVFLGSGGTGDPTEDFGVVKLTAAGAVDTTFGVGGLVTVGFNLQANGKGPDIPSKVAVRPDGEIVVAGTATQVFVSGQSFTPRAAVALLKADGTLDTGFNGTGKVTFVYAANADDGQGTVKDGATSLAVLADNRIVVAGQFQAPTGGTPSEGLNLAAARLTAVGVLDSTYGTAGVASTVLNKQGFTLGGGYNLPTAIGPDGSVVAAYADGFSQFSPVYGVRLAADGSRDTAFGTSGKADFGDTGGGTSLDPGTLVALAADSKVLLVTTVNDSKQAVTAVTRFSSAGVKDATYGTAGTFTGTGSTNSTTPYVQAADAAVLADGRVILAGFSNASSLLRLTAAGAPDAGFNGDGYVPRLIGGFFAPDYPSGAAVVRPTATGRLYVVQFTNPASVPAHTPTTARTRRRPSGRWLTPPGDRAAA